jgi:hypothetical protein
MGEIPSADEMEADDPTEAIREILNRTPAALEDIVQMCEQQGQEGIRENLEMFLQHFGLDPQRFDCAAIRNRTAQPIGLSIGSGPLDIGFGGSQGGGGGYTGPPTGFYGGAPDDATPGAGAYGGPGAAPTGFGGLNPGAAAYGGPPGAAGYGAAPTGSNQGAGG